MARMQEMAHRAHVLFFFKFPGPADHAFGAPRGRILRANM